MDYLKNILIGGIILAIVQNLEKIIDYISDLWNETLKPIFEWMNKWIFQPMMTGLKWIVNEGVPIVKEILAHPISQTVIDGIKAGLDEIGKLFGPLQNAINVLLAWILVLVKVEAVHIVIRHLGVFWLEVVLIWDQPRRNKSLTGFGESEFTLFRDKLHKLNLVVNMTSRVDLVT